jgi:hypothetical protein
LNAPQNVMSNIKAASSAVKTNSPAAQNACNVTAVASCIDKYKRAKKLDRDKFGAYRHTKKALII